MWWRKLKKLFVLVLAVWLLLPIAASAAQPLRIARLPLMLNGFMRPDDQTIDRLETKLDRAIHVPLNGVLNVVTYLPEGASEDALAEIIDEQRQKSSKKRLKLKDMMEPLAQRLEADIVICPVLTAYDEQIYHSFRWFGEMIVHSNAAVQINGYNRRTGKPFAKEVWHHSHDEYGVRSRASYLAEMCMDEVIEEAKLREMIPSAKELLNERVNADDNATKKENSHDD